MCVCLGAKRGPLVSLVCVKGLVGIGLILAWELCVLGTG